VRVGGDAYRDAPAFVRDNLDRLESERAPFKNLDHIVMTVESTAAASAYGRFCWTLNLAEDYQADFALSARAAYLIHAGAPPELVDLNVRGLGQPFTATLVEVPTASPGDKILLVMS